MGVMEQSPDSKFLSLEEVSKHNTSASLWLIIEGSVYDVTNFLKNHPGGKKVLLKNAGSDATKDFNKVHSIDIIYDQLSSKCHIGFLEKKNSNQNDQQLSMIQEESNINVELKSKFKLPPLQSILNISEFENIAQNILDKKSWTYYHSAADDMFSKNYNNEIYKKILFRPRTLRNVRTIDMSSSIVGTKIDIPIFISPAAMAKLGHPIGEKGLANASYKHGIVEFVSFNSSLSYKDIVRSKPWYRNQKFFFQLMINSDKKKTEKLLKRVLEIGQLVGVVVTVDGTAPGKREADEKLKFEDEYEEAMTVGDQKIGIDGGIGKTLFNGTSQTFDWSELKWLRNFLPKEIKIILKGIGSYEDVELAANNPYVDGVYLSNHGGRELDFVNPPLMVLQEVRKYVPDCFNKIDIIIDGGIKRGTDIVKALCLGAKGVGLGRAPLYSLAGYGEDGVSRLLEILKEEIDVAMRLLGVTKISDLGPQYINTRQLDSLIYQAKL